MPAPGENVHSWSATAADNDDADSSIGWAEGQTRESVNDSARGMMAAISKWRDLNNGSIVTAGAVNALTFVSGLGYTVTPETGLTCKLKIGPALTNTAACTLNMDGLGAVAILDNAGVALTTGVLVAGRYYDFYWDGTNWIVLALATVPATSTDQTTGTSTSTFVTPATQGLHKSAAKAWAFAGTAGNLVDSYNVSSVTDAAVGQIIVNFAPPLSGNYCVVGNGLIAPGGGAASTYITHLHGQTATSITMTLVNLDNFSASDPTNWHVTVFGT